jgi:hypothetical protein
MANLIALYALALLLGGMVFFSAVVAPLVFMRLPADHAGRFIRALFPFYYLFVLVSAALGACSMAWVDPTAAAVLAAVALVTLWLRQGLMVRINRLSDALRAGETTARRGFDRAHRISVLVNMAQILAAGWCLARLG